MSASEWEHLAGESRQRWDANAAYWDNRMSETGNRFAIELVFPAAERLLAMHPGESLLELACGNGTFARRQASQGIQVTATDYSPSLLGLARSRGGEIEYLQLDVTSRADMQKLAGRQYSAAVCNMAFMDIAAIEPLLEILPHLLAPAGRFVFTLMHPCFNSYGTFLAAESGLEGTLAVQHALKVTHYLTPRVTEGEAISGQPVLQYYFHRPLHILFSACFRAGWVIDGLEEPAFQPVPESGQPLSWYSYSEIPPVLAVRLRPTTY